MKGRKPELPKLIRCNIWRDVIRMEVLLSIQSKQIKVKIMFSNTRKSISIFLYKSSKLSWKVKKDHTVGNGTNPKSDWIGRLVPLVISVRNSITINREMVFSLSKNDLNCAWSSTISDIVNCHKQFDLHPNERIQINEQVKFHSR